MNIPDRIVVCRFYEYGPAGVIMDPSYPVSRHDYPSDSEELERLESALECGPRGAVAVSLIAVGLLMVGWLGLYFLVFLPRGTVG